MVFEESAPEMDHADKMWVTDTTFRDGQQARPPYTSKHESFKISDLATWLCAVLGVYGFVFGFGKLLLGSYMLGTVLLGLSIVFIYAMIKIVSRNEWWNKRDAPQE